MAEQVRFAVQGDTDMRLIEMPYGYAEHGARRHAAEHAHDTGQPVRVLRISNRGDGWDVLNAVVPEPIRSPLGQELAELSAQPTWKGCSGRCRWRTGITAHGADWTGPSARHCLDHDAGR